MHSCYTILLKQGAALGLSSLMIVVENCSAPSIWEPIKCPCSSVQFCPSWSVQYNNKAWEEKHIISCLISVLGQKRVNIQEASRSIIHQAASRRDLRPHLLPQLGDLRQAEWCTLWTWNDGIPHFWLSSLIWHWILIHSSLSVTFTHSESTLCRTLARKYIWIPATLRRHCWICILLMCPIAKSPLSVFPMWIEERGDKSQRPLSARLW